MCPKYNINTHPTIDVRKRKIAAGEMITGMILMLGGGYVATGAVFNDMEKWFHCSKMNFNAQTGIQIVALLISVGAYALFCKGICDWRKSIHPAFQPVKLAAHDHTTIELTRTNPNTTISS
jgi:hypothetical protein